MLKAFCAWAVGSTTPEPPGKQPGRVSARYSAHKRQGSRFACSRRAASLRFGLVSGPCGPPLALTSVHPHCSRRFGASCKQGGTVEFYASPLNHIRGGVFCFSAPSSVQSPHHSQSRNAGLLIPLPCTSSPNRTLCVGLRFGLGRKRPSLERSNYYVRESVYL